MGWTTPKDWILELVTAAMMNTHVRDNLLYLKGLFDNSGGHDHTGAGTDNSKTIGTTAIVDAAVTSRKWKPTITRVARTAAFTPDPTEDDWVDVTDMSIAVTPLTASYGIIHMSGVVQHNTQTKTMILNVNVDAARLDPCPDYWYAHFGNEPGNIAWTYYVTLTAAAHTIKLQVYQDATGGQVMKCEMILLVASQ